MIKHGAVYHVTARANRKEMIMYCNAMKKLFVSVLHRAKKKYHFQIINFCIMGNHIHLIIRPFEEESLSRIMQWILSVFAMAWNRAHHINGHVWGERFFSKIIESSQEFAHTFDYITQNPVRAQVVRNVWEWRYGGLWHFLTGNAEILGEPPPLLHLFYRIYCE
ncbi:transposase [Treponema sp. OttesenSCG-928-L16]|nr:transposase [Treponema sp. OttesenSCG-928-L16]